MVFISHAHQDKFYARQIEKRLSTLLRVFLDENDIEVGSRLEDTLRESIESCDSFLVILSNNSQNSDWVKYEIGAAWAFKKQIVQVRLDSVPQPSVAAGVLFIDARDQFEALDKIEEHYKKLRE